MEVPFSQLKRVLEARPGRALALPFRALRESAVLVPLLMRKGEAHVLFTRRPLTLRQHAGQISFPGGSRDPSDPTPLHTALRESEEELGIPPSQVAVLGRLDEIPTLTHFRIAPFVGVIPDQLAYVPSVDEVEEVIEVPLTRLLDPAIHRAEKKTFQGVEYDLHFYHHGPHVIWGATGSIVCDLLQRMRDLPPV